MYGLIVKMIAMPGRREALVAILMHSAADMPSCQSYVVANDLVDDNVIWITEVWDSKESHDASLLLPSVKKAMAAARPMIASIANHIVTSPVRGYGFDRLEEPLIARRFHHWYPL